MNFLEINFLEINFLEINFIEINFIEINIKEKIIDKKGRIKCIRPFYVISYKAKQLHNFYKNYIIILAILS